MTTVQSSPLGFFHPEPRLPLSNASAAGSLRRSDRSALGSDSLLSRVQEFQLLNTHADTCDPGGRRRRTSRDYITNAGSRRAEAGGAAPRLTFASLLRGSFVVFLAPPGSHYSRTRSRSQPRRFCQTLDASACSCGAAQGQPALRHFLYGLSKFDTHLRRAFQWFSSPVQWQTPWISYLWFQMNLVNVGFGTKWKSIFLFFKIRLQVFSE